MTHIDCNRPSHNLLQVFGLCFLVQGLTILGSSAGLSGSIASRTVLTVLWRMGRNVQTPSLPVGDVTVADLRTGASMPLKPNKVSLTRKPQNVNH